MNKEVSIEEVSNVISMSKIKKYLYLTIKRLLDIILSLFGILFLIPISIIIKISYILNKDFSSIFYSQIRIGKDGKEFKLYKFRSMIPNADEVLKELIKKEPYKTEWKNNQKLSKDPRITKMGNILRKTSLDELPQLLSIIKGDMSFIGPRPLVRGELDAHSGNHKIYESVKPGLSGWWACNGRSNLTYEERLNLEYYYCNNASLLLDIKCIFKTIKVVLLKKGAE